MIASCLSAARLPKYPCLLFNKVRILASVSIKEKSLRLLPLLAKVTIGALSKPILLFVIPLGSRLDSYFAAASVSGVLISICSTLLLPEIVSYLGDATSDEIELKKRVGNVIFLAFTVGILALFGYFLLISIWSLASLKVHALFQEPLLIACTFVGLMSQTGLEYIMRMLRLSGNDKEADTLSVVIQLCSSMLPIVFAIRYGIYGYAVASMLSLILLLIFTANEFNVRVRPVQVKELIQFARTAVKMLPLAFSTKLFPLVEIYSIGLLGQGKYSLYAAAKSTVLGLFSIIDIGYSQRLFARFQANINLKQYGVLAGKIRVFTRNIMLIFGFLGFIGIVFSKALIAYLASSQAGFGRLRLGFDLVECILLMLPLLPAITLASVNVQVLYALRDSSYVARSACATFALGALMMIALTNAFGLVGACIAISTYQAINGLVFSARSSCIMPCTT